MKWISTFYTAHHSQDTVLYYHGVALFMQRKKWNRKKTQSDILWYDKNECDYYLFLSTARILYISFFFVFFFSMSRKKVHANKIWNILFQQWFSATSIATRPMHFPPNCSQCMHCKRDNERKQRTEYNLLKYITHHRNCSFFPLFGFFIYST